MGQGLGEFQETRKQEHRITSECIHWLSLHVLPGGDPKGDTANAVILMGHAWPMVRGRRAMSGRSATQVFIYDRRKVRAQTA